MPLSLRAPTREALLAFLAARGSEPFSYAPVGATREAPPGPKGFALDHARIRLGDGASDFAAAQEAIRGWQMFALGWVELWRPATPIREGESVAVLARALGLHWLNACRIVYLVDEPDRFGFAYGTLGAHAERGEERFLVQIDREQRVWYDLLAFSRPASPLLWAGYPLARRLQRRFREDSLQAMARAVAAARGEAPLAPGRQGEG